MGLRRPDGRCSVTWSSKERRDAALDILAKMEASTLGEDADGEWVLVALESDGTLGPARGPFAGFDVASAAAEKWGDELNDGLDSGDPEIVSVRLVRFFPVQDDGAVSAQGQPQQGV